MILFYQFVLLLLLLKELFDSLGNMFIHFYAES